eukprot:230045_1
MDRNNSNKVLNHAYTYKFDANTPIWRYVFIGSLIPFVTLKCIGHIQMRKIPKWQYVTFGCIGAYLGAKHAFRHAKVSVDPDDFGIFPWPSGRKVDNSTITETMNKMGWYRKEQITDELNPLNPSLDNIIDYDKYNNDSYDEMNSYDRNDRNDYGFVERQHKKRYQDRILEARSKRNRDSDSYADDNDYNKHKANDTYNPDEDISEFFESNDKHKPHR